MIIYTRVINRYIDNTTLLVYRANDMLLNRIEINPIEQLLL